MLSIDMTSLITNSCSCRQSARLYKRNKLLFYITCASFPLLYLLTTFIRRLFVLLNRNRNHNMKIISSLFPNNFTHKYFTILNNDQRMYVNRLS